MTLRILLVQPVHRILMVANAIAEGDLSQDIAIHQRDEISDLAEAFRNMKNIIGHVLHEMDGLTQAIQEGKLEIRGNTGDFTGGWCKLVIGIMKSPKRVPKTEKAVIESLLAMG